MTQDTSLEASTSSSESLEKKELIANACESLLQEMESNVITLEQALYKTLRIARLVDDLKIQKWIRLELAGYHSDRLPVGITVADAESAAYLSSRYQKKMEDGKENWYYATESIPVLEEAIAADKLALQQTVMPSQVNPISQGFTQETYASVFLTVKNRQNELNQHIKQNQSYVSRCRSSLYNYVFTIYYRYKFDSVTESAFQQLKEQVDGQFGEVLPDALQQFSAAYERLGSKSATEFSQALSTCRNIIYAFADYVFPPQKEIYQASDGTKIEVKANQYKNRILAFLDKSIPRADNVSRLTKARVEELYGRIARLHDLQSEGTKNTVTIKEARLAVVDTYLLLGQLMDYLPKDTQATPKSSTSLSTQPENKDKAIEASKPPASKKPGVKTAPKKNKAR